MLSIPRNGSRCIYCAFRTHQLLLQYLRTRTSNRHLHLQSTLPLHHQDLIRYTNNHEQTGIYAPPRSHASRRNDQQQQPTRPKKFAGRTSKDGVVRKFFAGSELAGDGEGRRQNFEKVLSERLGMIKEELKDAPLLEELRKEREQEGTRNKVETFNNQIWKRFERNLLHRSTVERPSFSHRKDDAVVNKDNHDQSQNILRTLRETYTTRGPHALDDHLKHQFYAHLTNARFTPSDIQNQRALADLRYPSEWFPATRSMRRKIHLHVGPTNSGKTYHALKRLEQASTGVYAGPLRLLAHEVYSRMNAKGRACGLVTGEERRLPVVEEAPDKASGEGDTMATTGGGISACTVEMMPLNKPLDVAVIDEIQMIGNAERGWAWTQALLGVKAREVHLCGEERTVPLIREICASVGEELEIHRYQRLSPLEVAGDSLNGDLTLLRKGDCVVSFSVMGIHSLRRQIERATGKKVATVYGSLPPETRAQQARLFNDPTNEYDFLVASDAVGMGLNLAIKRIIFEASAKFDGFQHRQLGVADIKQIAGRAGRYRIATEVAEKEEEEEEEEDSAAVQDLAAAKGEPAASLDLEKEMLVEDNKKENTGFVTTLQKFDFPIVAAAMTSDPEPIKSAGLFPPAPVLERFAGYFPPGTPFSYILTRLHELSQMHTRFHLCGLKDQVWIADMIEPVKGLTITDRNIICSSPASGSDRDLWKDLMPAYARCIAEQSGGNIVDIAELPLEVLEAEISASREYLRELERLHKGVVCYLWLSYRFAGVFGQRSLAFHVKGLVEAKIEEVLGRFSFTERSYRKMREMREKSLLRDLEGAVAGVAGEGDAEGSVEVGEDVVREVAEMGDSGNGEERNLRDQTSLTAGGDHFGGEEDLGFEEPVDEEESDSGRSVWPGRMPEKGIHSEPGAVGNTIISDAAQAGEEAAIKTSLRDEVDIASFERPPAIGGDLSETATAVDQLSVSSGSEEILSPELDPTHIEIPVTPETELDEPPMETQEVSPKPVEARTPDEEERVGSRDEQSSSAGQNSKFGGVPCKHLAHLDVNARELGRGVDSRP